MLKSETTTTNQRRFNSFTRVEILSFKYMDIFFRLFIRYIHLIMISFLIWFVHIPYFVCFILLEHDFFKYLGTHNIQLYPLASVNPLAFCICILSVYHECVVVIKHTEKIQRKKNDEKKNTEIKRRKQRKKEEPCVKTHKNTLTVSYKTRATRLRIDKTVAHYMYRYHFDGESVCVFGVRVLPALYLYIHFALLTHSHSFTHSLTHYVMIVPHCMVCVQS